MFQGVWHDLDHKIDEQRVRLYLSGLIKMVQ